MEQDENRRRTSGQLNLLLMRLLARIDHEIFLSFSLPMSIKKPRPARNVGLLGARENRSAFDPRHFNALAIRLN